MSRPVPAETLPPTARTIALILASTPTIQDAQPGVLHQLLEFSHRYTSQVLSDALVYAEHAGRAGKIEMEDVVLAIQARVGWEFGGRVPKEYLLTLAAQTNAVPLPPVSEVFGIRLPPAEHTLTAVDFDIVPNKPPPSQKLYDEEIEEIEEESDEESLEQQHIPLTMQHGAHPPALAAPVSARRSPSDVDMATPGADRGFEASEDGAADDDDGLFAGDDDDSEGNEGMESVVDITVPPGPSTNGVKRKLVEEEDYD